MGPFRFLAPAAVAAIVCFQPAQAQVADDARALLNDSAAAIDKVESMTFSSRRYATGPLEGVLNTRGTVKLIRSGPDKTKAALRMTGKTQEAGRGARDFDVLVSDGIVTWVDASNKKVFERAVALKGEGSSEQSIAQQLIVDQLFGNEPYKQMLTSTAPDFKVTVEADEAVAGEPCKVIKASFNAGVREIFVHISASDKLPRKVELRGNPPKGAQNEKPLSMIVEITDVKINPGLKPTDLALGTPEGFERDIMKAPAPGQQGPGVNIPVEPTAPVAIGLPPGTEAPAFSLKGAQGETVTLDSMKNNVVVLAFWGTWNGTWKKASPTIEKLNASFAGKPVKMLGIACRETDPKAVGDRWAADKMSFPTVIGDEATPVMYQVKGYPTFVIVGGDGKVVDFVQGFPGDEQFTARMNASIQRGIDSIKK